MQPGEYVWLTYEEVYDIVLKVGASVHSCGVEKVKFYFFKKLSLIFLFVLCLTADIIISKSSRLVGFWYI